ncbi:MAG: AMP-binding protein [Beijerinckiaceae bacterium]
MIIGADIDIHAREAGAKSALACGDESLDWRQFAALTNRTANWLNSVAPEHASVALLLPNCAALPVLFFAIARSGRNALVLDPAWPASIVAPLLQKLGSALAIGSKGTILPGQRGLMLDERNSLRALHELVQGFADAFEPTALPEHIFYTGFTSGSTGMPKGYRRNHRSWTESFRAERIEFGNNPADIVVAPGSLSHSLFLYAVTHALHIGATAVIARHFRPSAIPDLVSAHRGSLLYGVPSQLMTIAAAPPRGMSGSNSLRRIISSGSKWPQGTRDALRSKFPHAGFAEFYGASELSFVSVAREEDATPAGSVGRPFATVEVSIRDDDCQPVPPGTAGEIFVRSSMLFDGYAGEENGGVLAARDGYASVGDMGYLDANGCLFLAGRKDRMIVTAGKNLYPEEIEQVLMTHPAIEAAMVLPDPDPLRGSRIVAAVNLSEGASVSAAEMIGYARRHLPLFKVPRRYYRVGEWPRTRSGKSDFERIANMLSYGVRELLP